MAKRANVRRVVSDAQDQGAGAVDAVRDVRDNVADAIDKSLERRPYTTLLLAVGLGFLLGAMLGTLELDPEKWVPVFRKDHAQTKLERATLHKAITL